MKCLGTKCDLFIFVIMRKFTKTTNGCGGKCPTMMPFLYVIIKKDRCPLFRKMALVIRSSELHFMN